MPGPPDEDLYRRTRSGDEAAFAALYGRWQAPLYRFALRMSGQPALAEDVVHEVFMTLIRGSAGYDPARGPLGPYLHGVARHQIQRRLARERPYVALPDAEGAAPLPADPGFDPLAELTRRERVERVRTAVRSLPLPYREVLVLCDLEAWSYDDAARALECSPGTIRSRLHRARRLLLGKLQALGTAASEAAGARR
jgi:RNA polymerase sigma-70 factor (ECF subfamily)